MSIHHWGSLPVGPGSRVPAGARPPARRCRPAALLLAAVLGLGAFAGAAAAKEYTVGLQADLSGPTQNIGAYAAAGFEDYMKLFNKEGGLGPGNSIKVVVVDTAYNVPKALEGYERQKAEGALEISCYGTPPTIALTPKLTAAHILGTAPGVGEAVSRNGEKYPYIFPIAASYWSQAAAAVKFIEDRWTDTARKPRIAYLMYDNPAGREPLPIFEALQKQLGFEFRTWAVPPPGLDMAPQALEIARQYKPDWVITHLFGKAPSVSIKEFARVGFPRNKIISFVWGAAEVDINLAGLDISEGYHALEFAGVGEDFDVIRKIRAMYKAEGKSDAAFEKNMGVYYNRWVLTAAVQARAIQLAIQKHGPDITSEQVAQAMETIRDFSLGGLLPPLNLTHKDHEGGGWVRMYQVKGGKFQPETDWYRAYPELLEKFVYGQG